MTNHPSSNAENPGYLHRQRLLWVSLAAGAFVILMSAGLGHREFWIDETVTVGHIRLATTLDEPFHPPGYYWLLFQWKKAFGGGDLALRAFSVPWALAAFTFVWLLARSLLKPPADLLALGLFVLSPLAILYLRMARYFAMTMAVSLAVAYLLLLAAQRGKWRDYLLLGLAAAALLWTDYVPAVLLLPAYLYLLYRAVGRGGGRELGRWLVATIIPLAAISPWMSYIISGSRSIHQIPPGHLQETLYGIVAKTVLPFYAAIVGETTDPWRFYVTVPVFLAGMALLVTGFALTGRQRQPGRWLKLSAWPAAVVLVVILLSTVASSEPLPRITSLTLFALPFAYILMAQGAARLRLWGLGAVLLGMVFLGNLYGLHNYFTRQQFLNPGYNVPWRAITSTIAARSQPDDILIEYYDSTFCRYWEGQGEVIDYHNYTSPEEMQLLEEFGAHDRRVWLITRDRGADLPRKLAAGLRERLTPQAEKVEVFSFMPLSATERYWRQRLLRRPAWDAYMKVYLFYPR